MSASGSLYSLKRIWSETLATSLALPLILLSVFSAIFSSTLILPLYLGEITRGLQSGRDMLPVASLTILALLCLLIGYGFELAAKTLAAHINRKICLSLTARHSKGHIRSSVSNFARFKKTDFAGAISDVLELLYPQQLYILEAAIPSALITVATLLVLLFYNSLFFIITFPFVIAICVLPILLASRATPYINREPQLFSQLGGFLSDLVKFRRLLHFYDASRIIDNANVLADELHGVQTGKWWLWNLSFNVKLTQNFILYALLLLGGGYLYFEGRVALDSVVTAYVLVTMATPKLDSLYKLYNNAQSSSAAYRALDRLLLSPDTEKNGAETPLSNIQSISLEIESFAYSRKAAPLLRDISLTLETGQKCLLMGDSGSGKSTLLDLLLGLNNGPFVTLRINGRPITQGLTSSYWRQVAYIPNPDLIFENLTAKENAELYGDLTSQRLRMDARKLDFHIFEEELGRNLSGGEKQRLAFIRAVSRDKTVLVFDEPTSALDMSMQDATFRLLSALQDKIIVVASHGQGIEQYFDRVFELRDKTLHERAKRPHE